MNPYSYTKNLKDVVSVSALLCHNIGAGGVDKTGGTGTIVNGSMADILAPRGALRISPKRYLQKEARMLRAIGGRRL